MNKKNFIIIILIFIVVIGFLSSIFYFNLKDSNQLEVEATVKLVGNNYIIVYDDDGNEYSINTDYYIEGASTVVYDSQGGNPSYFKQPYKIF
jgi:uncharacterized protein YpmB